MKQWQATVAGPWSEHVWRLSRFKSDTSCCFFTFFAERQKRKKAARGVRFKSGLVWRLLRVLCFDSTYLCNKDENRWNDEFFVSEDLIHRFPSVDFFLNYQTCRKLNTKTPHATGLHQPARVCSSYCDVTGERVHEAVPALSAWSRQRRSRQRRHRRPSQKRLPIGCPL